MQWCRVSATPLPHLGLIGLRGARFPALRGLGAFQWRHRRAGKACCTLWGARQRERSQPLAAGPLLRRAVGLRSRPRVSAANAVTKLGSDLRWRRSAPMPMVTTSAVVMSHALEERWDHRRGEGLGPRVMALLQRGQRHHQA